MNESRAVNGGQVSQLIERFKQHADFDGTMSKVTFRNVFSWTERRLLLGYEGGDRVVAGETGGPLSNGEIRLVK